MPYPSFPEKTVENSPSSDFTTSIEASENRLVQKCFAYSGAYIYVLEAQKAAREGHTDLHSAMTILETQLEPAGINIRQYFRSMLFVDLVSEAELFFSALLRAVLLKNPKKVGGIQFRLADVIDAASIEDLILRASDDYLYKLLYKKPGEYLADLCSTLSIDESSISSHWPIYIEAKARRDLGAHNSWVCNQTYLRKLKEADITSSAQIGDSMIPHDRDYARVTSSTIAKLAIYMVAAVKEQHCPASSEA